LLYKGPVGVAGVNVQQSWDITKLPVAVREDPNVRDLFRIFVRQVDIGLSLVDSAVDFLPASGPPEEIVLTLSASGVDVPIEIEFWFLHSVIR
jgi:hypothetical protein